MSLSLQDRFRGCLLGSAIGDALGGRFEAQSAEYIRRRIPTISALVDYVQDGMSYTDDTQMTIAVAEALATRGEISEPKLCTAFVADYDPTRGYGRGARAVLAAMEEGRDHRAVAAKYFPGGSYGNGAAMRVAPVGIFFRDNVQTLLQQARLSALPTHVHPLGIEGAQLLALAVAFAANVETFDRDAYFNLLLRHCESHEFRGKLELGRQIESADQFTELGNGIEALESVVTAIASFALTPHSYAETIGNLIFLGGDTDTLAAMGGAISGAFLGVAAIPKNLVAQLEQTVHGRAYILDLADRLLAASTIAE